MPTMAMAHIQKTAPGPPSVIATATPAMFPPPTRPPTESNRASRAVIAFGSPDWFRPDRTRNILKKYLNCTNPLAIVKNKPNTTRNGTSAHPHVRSPMTPKKDSKSSM